MMLKTLGITIVLLNGVAALTGGPVRSAPQGSDADTLLPAVPTTSTASDTYTSQVPTDAARKKKPSYLPRELPDDLPGSPAMLSRRTSSPAAIVTHGRFTSVQVNVDSMGDNIVNDAANEPSIAIDPTDPSRIVIGWRQFDTIASNFREAGWAYSHDTGQTWTFPGVLEPGVFASDPVLDFDLNGNIYYLSFQSGRGPGLYPCYLYRSSDGGVTWPQEVYAYGGDKAWLAIDRTNGPGSGNLYSTWNSGYGCCGNAIFTRSTNGGLRFMPPIPLEGNPFVATYSVGPNGDLNVFGAIGTISAPLIFLKSTDAQNPAVTPTFSQPIVVNLDGWLASGSGPNPGGGLGQAWVATDHSGGPRHGNIYVLASVDPTGGDPLDVMFSRSTDGGLTWSVPVRVNDDPVFNGAWQWFGTMSVAPNGRIDVVWNDTRNSGLANVSETFYAYSMDAGATWSSNITVSPPFDSHIGWPSQNKLGDYYDMISDQGGTNLAYAATFNGEQDVYFLRIWLDCNNNGIEDPTDIDDATSDDCNENRVPDECEPDVDCNDNSVQDICDIASATSEDCNWNNVPDECEPDEDCNSNTAQDICDIADGTSGDCNANLIPDECDIATGAATDVNSDGVPDECQGACCQCGTCVNTAPNDCVNVGWEYAGPGNLCTGEVCGPALENDDCAARETLPSLLDQVVDFDNRCATNDGPESVMCGGSTATFGADLWYEFVPSCTGDMTVSLCANTDFDSLLAVYGNGDTACVCPTDGSSQLVCGDDTCGAEGGPSTVTLSVDADACYMIRVAGWGGAKGTGEMNVHVSCDDCYPTSTTDCNENGIPDECDILHATSEDCNENGVPDECDIIDGTSVDVNGGGIPDECESAISPRVPVPPHDARKNRYLTVDTGANDAVAVAYQVMLASMRRCSGDLRRACVVVDDCPNVCVLNQDLQCNGDTICGEDGPCVATSPCIEHSDVGAVTKWLDQPFESTCTPLDDCAGQMFAHLRSDALFRVWTEETLHITGCEIVPVAEYEVRSTVNGIVFSPPLAVATISKPNVHYGDCVGPVVGEVYTAPDGHTNVTDVQAFLAAQTGAAHAPNTTWVDLHSSTSPVVPQQILNVGDLQTIKFGFLGQTYVETPGQVDPGNCP